MKNLRLTATLLVLFSSLLFVNCTPDQVESYSTTKDVISQGKWSVNYYFDGQDRTASFHDFQFDFKSDGALTVVYGTTTLTGTWVSYKDADGEVLTFKVDSPQTALSALNTDWIIGSMSLNSIGMKNSTNTQLVFRKL